MSIVESVTIGDLRFTPVDFTGLSVTVQLESVARQAEGDPIYTEVLHAGEVGDNARPVVPIAVWETIQEAAHQVIAYGLAFAGAPNGSG